MRSVQFLSPSFGTAVVVSEDAVSPPNALEVVVPSSPGSVAGLWNDFGVLAFGTVTCHTRWRVVERPADTSDNHDIMTFELAGGATAQVFGVTQAIDGTVAFYANGPSSPLIKLTDGWHELTLGIDRELSTFYWATDDDEPVARVVSVDSSWTNLKVFVGAYDVRTGPWKVLFDNVYCTRTP